MPIEDVERSFAREDDIIDFFLNGSEFLLLKSWQDIARRLKAQGVRVRVSTNGMLSPGTLLIFWSRTAISAS